MAKTIKPKRVNFIIDGVKLNVHPKVAERLKRTAITSKDLAESKKIFERERQQATS